MHKVSNGAKIRNGYNQAPHLTKDTIGKVKRGYQGTGKMQGECIHNPEDWNNKIIKWKCGEAF